MSGNRFAKYQDSLGKKFMATWVAYSNDIGLLILRLFFGIRLIYGVQDNILHPEKMNEFEVFLSLHHFPWPVVSAIISVYAQAIAGLLFIVGWHIRWAAILMVVNFALALVMVHWGQTFEQMTTVLFMLICPIALLFTGAGRFSLDKK